MHRKTLIGLSVATALAWSSPAFAQASATPRSSTTTQTTPSATSSQSATKLSASSAAFLKAAAEGNLAEVELAKTAQEKSSNAAVKSLAKKIEDDHTQSQSELSSLAASKSVTLPTDANAMQKSDAARLDKLSGAAFDKAYVDLMVRDHQKDIATFKQHAKDTDPDVASFVTKTLPALQGHLQMAQSAQSAVNGAKSSTGASMPKTP